MYAPRIATVLASAILVTAALLAGTQATEAARSSESGRLAASPAVEQFLALEERGVLGSFELTYHVSGQASASELNGAATLVVAQRAAPGTTAWPDRAGTWSYRLTESPDAVFQWVEHGNQSEDCFVWLRHSTRTCTGPAAYVPSIGFTLATLPFLPGSVLDGLRTDLRVVGNPHAERSTVFAARGSATTGPLRCLRANEAGGETVCLTSDGTLATVAPYQEVGLVFGSVVLAARPSMPSASAFILDRRPAMPFVLPPM